MNGQPDSTRIEAILKEFEQRLREIDAKYAGKLRTMISEVRERRLAQLRESLDTKSDK